MPLKANVSRNYRFIAVAFVVLFLAAGLILYLNFREPTESLDSKLIAKYNNVLTDDLWFTSDGALTGIRRDGSRISVMNWSHNQNRLERQEYVDLDGFDGVAWAVSSDTSLAAWTAGDVVRVRQVGVNRPPSSAPLGRGVEVTSLALAGSRLVLARSDGTIELRGDDGRLIGTADVKVKDPGPLRAMGNFVGAFSRSSREAYVFDTRGGRLQVSEVKRAPANISMLALSPGGRIAVATHDGSIQSRGLITAPGAVRVMSFFKEDQLVAAGAFGGIHLLSPEFRPTRVADATAGTVRAVAAMDDRFAFCDGSATFLFNTQWVRGVKETGFWPGWWLLFALGALGAFLIAWAVLANLLKRKRRIRRVDPEEEEEEIPPLVPPQPLIDACLAGSGILYAGSGLSAQSGLPAWQEALGQMVEWTVTSAMASEEQAEHWRTALANNERRPVEDGLADLCGTNSMGLHRFLQNTFLRAVPVSTAQQLVKSIPFAAAITTNVDELLDDALTAPAQNLLGPENPEALLNALRKRLPFLLKPYGTLADPDNFRFGTKQYAEAVDVNHSYFEFFEEMFATRVLLFIGASLEGIEADLKYIVFQRSPMPRHYAVAPVTDGWRQRAHSIEQRYGVRVLPYIAASETPNGDPRDPHADVVAFLEKLAAATIRPLAARA